MSLDVHTNREAQKWSKTELARRLLWDLTAPVFRIIPRQFWLLRRLHLRLFGARIGQHVHIYPSVKITIPWNLDIDDNCGIGDGAILYALGPISIGRDTTISQGANLCAGSHDHTKPDRPLTKPPIRIGHGVWVCADAFIGPGVSIGDETIVGARSVVMRDLEPGCIVAGNPAKVVRKK